MSVYAIGVAVISAIVSFACAIYAHSANKDPKGYEAKLNTALRQDRGEHLRRRDQDVRRRAALEEARVRVLTENPAVGVRGPDRDGRARRPVPASDRRRYPALCEDVGLRWRSNYAVAMYTGMRRGELVTLRAADVKLEEGYITVAKAHSRATGGEKGTTTNKVRKVPIEPALKPLLEALVKHPQGNDGRLLDVHATHSGAEELRKHAARAGLTRDDVFANDDQRRPLDFHDLRHTYATWLALAGVDVMVIKQRGGWKDLDTVQRYVEEAEAVGRGNIGTPFPALPASLLAEAARGVSEGLSENLPRNIKKTAGKLVGRPGLEPGTYGLKVRSSNQLSYQPETARVVAAIAAHVERRSTRRRVRSCAR